MILKSNPNNLYEEILQSQKDGVHYVQPQGSLEGLKNLNSSFEGTLKGFERGNTLNQASNEGLK